MNAHDEAHALLIERQAKCLDNHVVGASSGVPSRSLSYDSDGTGMCTIPRCADMEFATEVGNAQHHSSLFLHNDVLNAQLRATTTESVEVCSHHTSPYAGEQQVCCMPTTPRLADSTRSGNDGSDALVQGLVSVRAERSGAEIDDALQHEAGMDCLATAGNLFGYAVHLDVMITSPVTID